MRACACVRACVCMCACVQEYVSECYMLMPSQCVFYLGVFDPLYPFPPLLYKMKYNWESSTVSETDYNQFMKRSKKKVTLTFNSAIQSRLCQLNTEENIEHGLFECKLWPTQIFVSEHVGTYVRMYAQ